MPPSVAAFHSSSATERHSVHGLSQRTATTRGNRSEKGVANAFVRTSRMSALMVKTTEWSGWSIHTSGRTVDEFVRAGTVQHVGMSNYHAREVARAFALCEAHGLQKPTVFQGLYNPLNRLVEEELLPLLKEHECAFIAYNPLAAGLLTGRHASADGAVAAGRFKDNPKCVR